MLSPDTRAILLQELAPPEGSHVEAAIATTFTLDLTATLIPALAFSSYSFAGASADPIAALESIRQTADRVDVFCQGGGIAIPAKAPDLLAFLEPMVHEVERPPGGLFHPKVWFVKYADADAPSYRLLVLTRNLSTGNSWDLAVRLDSTGVSARDRAANKPLADFLASLPARTIRDLPAARTSRIRGLAAEARRVVWHTPDVVEEMDFHYLSGQSARTLRFSGRRHLVVSPFVNDGGLDMVSQDAPITILSRAADLERLSPETVERLEAFVMDSMAVVDHSQDSANLLGQLHAKMYVVEPWGRKQQARVLIGSANATDAAFGRNVEFLVEFRGKRRRLGVEAFLGSEAPFRKLVESYQPAGGATIDPAEQEQKQLENLLRAIAEIPHQVQVGAETPGPSDERRFEISVSTQRAYPLRDSWSATVELMTLRGHAVHASHTTPVSGAFSNVATADITPFLVIVATTSSGASAGAVVRADLLDAPEDRLDVILARQIDTPEKFLRFLYLLLSLGNPYLLAQLAGSGDGQGGSEGGAALRNSGAGILELILRALTTRSGALADINRLVDRLQATEQGRQVLPEGFDALWQIVQQAEHKLGEHTL